MSYLRSAICTLFTKHRTDQYALADSSNLSFEQIQEWLVSSHLMTPKDLVRLARAFNLKPKEYKEAHATLLRGFLKDQIRGPGAELIYLEQLPTPDWVLTSQGVCSVSPAFMRDLKLVLDQLLCNNQFRSIIRNLANQCRKDEASKTKDNL